MRYIKETSTYIILLISTCQYMENIIKKEGFKLSKYLVRSSVRKLRIAYPRSKVDLGYRKVDEASTLVTKSTCVGTFVTITTHQHLLTQNGIMDTYLRSILTNSHAYRNTSQTQSRCGTISAWHMSYLSVWYWPMLARARRTPALRGDRSITNNAIPQYWLRCFLPLSNNTLRTSSIFPRNSPLPILPECGLRESVSHNYTHHNLIR